MRTILITFIMIACIIHLAISIITKNDLASTGWIVAFLMSFYSYTPFKKIKMENYYFRKFTKEERSSFPYWYYHWKAFNLLALSLGVWRFKYLFHDIEKPWLRLFWDYPRVQKWHREHNNHHTSYQGGLEKIDWEALVIDNECSRYTKLNASMTAKEYFLYVVNEKPGVSNELLGACVTKGYETLKKLGLW